MLYLLAFIGVWAVLHYASKAASKILLQFGTWCENVSTELFNQKKELNKIRKQIRCPSVEDDPYTKMVRQEIDTLINNN